VLVKRYPWVRYLRKTAAELPYDSPIYLGSHSNGEYFHTETPFERKLRDAILRAGDDKARQLGLDRREFMASAMGFATALSVIQTACSSKGGSSAGTTGAPIGGTSGIAGAAPGAGGASGTPAAGASGVPAPGTGGSGASGTMAQPASGAGGASGTGAGGSSGTIAPGVRDPNQPGQYCFDLDSGVDPTMCEEAARAVLAAPDFIVDCQTHCFDDAPDAMWRSSPPPGFNTSLTFLLGGNCANTGDPVTCIGRDEYVRLMFLESDTTVAVLSVWPYGQGPSDPNPNSFIADTRDWVNADLAGSQRVVNHASVVPPLGTGQMQTWADNLGVGGWKVYPASYPNFFMDDATGRAVIESAIASGVKTFAIHKGLPIAGFSTMHNMPRDIGVVAKEYKDVNFIVYHSAICAGQSAGGFVCSPMEGPYVDGSLEGTDALITSLKDNGVGPNQNVYAELGGAFSQLIANPTSAGQWLAKLVEHVGENNVVWGTDSILSGNSPKGQINAFMALSHPALTPAVKKKILGENAARIYCIDPAAKRCQVDSSKLALHKRELDQEFGEYRWVLLGQQRPLGITTRREFVRLVRFKRALGIPG
jgi:hypothetical protein